MYWQAFFQISEGQPFQWDVCLFSSEEVYFLFFLIFYFYASLTRRQQLWKLWFSLNEEGIWTILIFNKTRICGMKFMSNFIRVHEDRRITIKSTRAMNEKDHPNSEMKLWSSNRRAQFTISISSTLLKICILRTKYIKLRCGILIFNGYK